MRSRRTLGQPKGLEDRGWLELKRVTKQGKFLRQRYGYIEQSGKLQLIRQGWNLGYLGQLISRISRKTTDSHNLENYHFNYDYAVLLRM